MPPIERPPNLLAAVEALRTGGARQIKLPPGECPSCDRDRASMFHPPHDASPNCRSGKHSHCSCDVCF